MRRLVLMLVCTLGVSLSLHGQAGAAGTLWAGTATIERVSQVTPGRASAAPQPVLRPFTFPVYLLVYDAGDGGDDGDGGEAAHLLRELVLLPGPAGPELLVSREAIAAGVAAARPSDLRSGIRHTSAAFSFDAPSIPLSGALALDGALSGAVTLRAGDRVNPFVHAAHPHHTRAEKHDRAVTRAIMLTPGRIDATGGVLTGRYEERLTGLTAREITVEGRVTLERIWQGDRVSGLAP
ncbi:MAG: hypothetical protein AAF577_08935 [Pseudomonadota bacterium]